MKRYLNQKDTYSCGPIAIVNAFKWLGYSATSKDLPVLSEICKLDKEHGTTIPNLDKGLKHMCKKYKHPKIKRTTKITIDKIEKLISQGKAVLADFAWKREKGPGAGRVGGHYFLITGGMKGFLVEKAWVFKTVNGPVNLSCGKKSTSRILPRIDLAWILKHRQFDWPTAWILNEK